MSSSGGRSPVVVSTQAWAGHAQWRILDTHFGPGLRFLASWRAWRDDPARPRVLHVVGLTAQPAAVEDITRAAAAHPELNDLAATLASRWWGLSPGVHRLSFEGGQVLLTLVVGEATAALRELRFEADAVVLDHPDADPFTSDRTGLQALARLCRRGTGLIATDHAEALRQALGDVGFVIDADASGDDLHARFDPAWTPRARRSTSPQPTQAVVIGAGLAGAAVAASLARRGWQVEVIDAADAPASGASGLPAGLLAPHHSPDDNLLTRLTRCGVRLTLAECEALLTPADWQRTGALERRPRDHAPMSEPGEAVQPWSRPARDEERAWLATPAFGHPDDTPPDPALHQHAPGTSPPLAVWHAQAAWVRPGALVRAWLGQDGVRFRGGVRVARLERTDVGWLALDAHGAVVARAPLMVVAAAVDSAALLHRPLRLHAVRGQVTWGGVTDALAAVSPPFAVHGSGHLLPRVNTPDGPAWFLGATYGRRERDLAPREADRAANLDRLSALLPAAARALAPAFARGEVRDWTGVRCASADRRPLVGPVEPGLWLLAALGSRGLSLAALCAELLAARLHGEPLPLPARLAQALDLERQMARESASRADV